MRLPVSRIMLLRAFVVLASLCLYSENEKLQKGVRETKNHKAQSVRDADGNVTLTTTNQDSLNIPFNATHLPKLAFLHIGKTAGTTLSFEINGACMNPQACRKNRPFIENESLPAQAMKRYFHVNQMDRFHPKEFDGYILPVRNPLDRIVSAYMMYHSKNARRPVPSDRAIIQAKFYTECFPHANDMAEYGLVGSPSPSNFTKQLVTAEDWLSLSCRNLAHLVVSGECKLPLFWHFYYNYKRYCSKVLEHIQSNTSKLVLVVRQEHLWSDWNGLHVLLGGNDSFTTTHTRNHVHDSRAFQEHNKTLSILGKHNLCRVLQKEIQIYLQVLQKATNLNQNSVKEAVETIKRQCGDSLVVHELLSLDDNDET